MSEGPKKVSASRLLTLKTMLLKAANEMLEKDRELKRVERKAALDEKLPPLQLSGLSAKDLQELCKELQRKIDKTDEERYDAGVKVIKNSNEIESLNQKISAMKGMRRRPALRKVKMTSESSLNAIMDVKHKYESVDFKANLKTVRKDDEKKEEVTDWRKNVEAMTGMEGRKKLFEEPK